MHLSIPKIWLKVDFQHPMKRQNFGDTPGQHTAPQRCQPDRSGTLDFLLDSSYCDRDWTRTVAG